MHYSILDPTGNITALVEDKVSINEQPRVAKLIMSKHPEVEQVGFVCFSPSKATQVCLRMAGGEFCGNATMCAAALFFRSVANAPNHVRLTVSGSRQPVEVSVRPVSPNEYKTSILMPPPVDICNATFVLNKTEVTVPIVVMEGISHAIVDESSVAFCLKNQQSEAQSTVMSLCDSLNADGLGLMFLERRADDYALTPLVYVPQSNTVFWESSCASGSAAVGAYLSWHSHSPINVTLHEPGGDLLVESDWSTRRTTLHGSVAFA